MFTFVQWCTMSDITVLLRIRVSLEWSIVHTGFWYTVCHILKANVKSQTKKSDLSKKSKLRVKTCSLRPECPLHLYLQDKYFADMVFGRMWDYMWASQISEALSSLKTCIMNKQTKNPLFYKIKTTNKLSFTFQVGSTRHNEYNNL